MSRLLITIAIEERPFWFKVCLLPNMRLQNDAHQEIPVSTTAVEGDGALEKSVQQQSKGDWYTSSAADVKPEVMTIPRIVQ
jgi:hypothetical protein